MKDSFPYLVCEQELKQGGQDRETQITQTKSTTCIFTHNPLGTVWTERKGSKGKERTLVEKKGKDSKGKWI